MNINDGIKFCANEYEAEVFVPNSRDEAVFIGQYLQEKKVSTELKVPYFSKLMRKWQLIFNS